MLRKPFITRFVPAVAEVPYRAAHTQCGPVPPEGIWVQRCEGSWLPAGTNAGYPVYVFIIGGPCRWEWVPYSTPGAVACQHFPEQQHVPGSSAYYAMDPDFGWTSGGNSIEEQAGDFVIRDEMGLVVGAAWGITVTRDEVPALERLTHAFLFGQDQGSNPLFAIIESTEVVAPNRPYNIGDRFEIRRIDSQVSYYRNDELVYRSSVLSVGPAMVGSSLYASGDQIP